MRETVETVVLVHGLWMHGLVFLPQRWALERRGFSTHSFSYRSLHCGLEENARALADFVANLDAPLIHVAGHSLGGLVALSMLARQTDPRIHRVVLMGSPYAGCYAATTLMRAGLSAMIGRSLRDWLSQPPPAVGDSIEIGVIAGSRSMGLGRVIPGLPKPNDGVVAVAETRVPPARDSILLPVAHSEMLISMACADQVSSFLRTGHFAHGKSRQDISANSPFIT